MVFLKEIQSFSFVVLVFSSDAMRFRDFGFASIFGVTVTDYPSLPQPAVP